MAEPTLQGTTGVQATVAKGAIDPEAAAVKLLLKLLDKAFKTSRTYGTSNPVAQKFFQEFYAELTARLETLGTLTFVVQRSELYFRNEVVYQTESQTENLAFSDAEAQAIDCENRLAVAFSKAVEGNWRRSVLNQLLPFGHSHLFRAKLHSSLPRQISLSPRGTPDIEATRVASLLLRKIC